RLRLDLRNSLQMLGEGSRILDQLRAMEATAEELGDQHTLGLVWSLMASYHFQIGNPTQAVDMGERAGAIGASLGNLTLQATSDFVLGRGYFSLADHRRAIDSFVNVVTALTGELVYDRCGLSFTPAISARAWLCLCFAEQGEFARGVAIEQESLALAE